MSICVLLVDSVPEQTNITLGASISYVCAIPAPHHDAHVADIGPIRIEQKAILVLA